MLHKLSGILIVIFFFIGLGILSYPKISNYLNELSQADVISDYNGKVSRISDEEKAEIIRKAEAYNEKLIGNVVLTDPFDAAALQKQNTEYNELLNTNNDGIMGYVEIPGIQVSLPVYHGTNADVLELGAGHLLNTSLPVGGQGTHAVISAHAGLPSAKLFTDLNQLEEGNKFYLQILGDTLAYEVNQIKVVEPHDTSDLLIDIEQDYVTLITCTPYGINSHRLLVRGTRVPYQEQEYNALKEDSKHPILIYAVIIIIVILLILIWLLRKRYRKKHEN